MYFILACIISSAIAGNLPCQVSQNLFSNLKSWINHWGKKVTLKFCLNFWILTHRGRNSLIERTLMYVHVFTFFCDSSFFTFSLSQSPKLWSSFLIWMPHKFASKLKSLTVSEKDFKKIVNTYPFLIM